MNEQVNNIEIPDLETPDKLHGVKGAAPRVHNLMNQVLGPESRNGLCCCLPCKNCGNTMIQHISKISKHKREKIKNKKIWLKILFDEKNDYDRAEDVQ